LTLNSAYCAVAGIPRSDHNNNARAHEPVNLDTHRTLSARKPLRVELIANAEIHTLHPHQLFAVEFTPHVLEGAHDVHRVPLAILVEHLQAHELCVRSNTGEKPRIYVPRLSKCAIGIVRVLHALDDHGRRCGDVGTIAYESAGDDPGDVRTV